MKKKGFFKKNYSLCWKFLNEFRWHVVLTLGIFCFFFLIGFALPIFFREEIINLLAELMLSIEGKTTFELICFILLNNVKVSFLALILGIAIGIFPFVTLVFNGYVLGFVARETANQEGIFILWRLLPHGIFELPAVFFSIAIGMKIGLDLFKKDWRKKLNYNYREGLRFFVFVIVPFLVIAAIIEGILIFCFS